MHNLRGDARQSCLCALARRPLSVPGLAAGQPAAARRRAPPAGRQMSPRSPPTKPGGHRRPILYTQPCRRGGGRLPDLAQQFFAVGGRRAADHMEDMSTGAWRGVQGCTRPEPKQGGVYASPLRSEARGAGPNQAMRSASQQGRTEEAASSCPVRRAPPAQPRRGGWLARGRLG